MFRVIYTSSATAPFSREELEELLQKSRRNNMATDLTGMMIYKDGNFMQLVEGPERAVRDLMGKISRDPRHGNFTILMEGPILQRSFETWSMGFKNITPGTRIDLPGYIESDKFSLISNHFIQNPPKSLDLLLSLKKEG